MIATKKSIDTFLHGDDYTTKYITYIQASDFSNEIVYLQCPPNENKKIYSSIEGNARKLKPFIWLRKDIFNRHCENINFKNFLKNHKVEIENCVKSFNDKYIERMEEGYNILLSSKHSTIRKLKDGLNEVGITEYITNDSGHLIYYDEENREIKYNTDGTVSLVDQDGNIDKIIDEEQLSEIKTSKKRNDEYICLSAVEQYMIQNKIKLFKGFDLFEDLHIMSMDIETTFQDKHVDHKNAALYPQFGRIFQIGIYTNKGYKKILTCEKDDPEQELYIIKEFFNILLDIKPNILVYHNGEWFDIDFMLRRLAILDFTEEDLQNLIKRRFQETYIRDDKSLGKNDVKIDLYIKNCFNRYRTTLKVGGNTESKTQTNIFGISCIDTIDAVKRASELDRHIPSNKLKEVVKYIGKEKTNRVYIKGDNIGRLFADKRDYYYNKNTGKYELATKENTSLLKEGYILTKGKIIEEQYLVDDLEETLALCNYYIQASFLLSKWLPINFSDTCKIGGASIWMKLLFSWSYQNNLAIPKKETHRPYVGGLVAMLTSGYIKKGVKLDFAALYPSCFMEHVPTPEHDITNFMKTCLSFSMDTRNEYKFLKNKYKEEGNSELSKKYDALQHPLKIANNSFYGMLAFYAAFWSSIDSAEMVTCIGRQAERFLHKHFKKFPLETIYCHTDAIHCEILDESIEDIEYTGIGNNSLVKKDKLYKGLEAVVAEFNDLYMKGYMGLDIDEYFDSCINFAKSNYITRKWNNFKNKNEYKSVGATAKTKTKSKYIGDFLNKQKENLLLENGISFKNSYKELVLKILKRELTNEEISSSARVKMSNSDYNNIYIYKKNKNGDLLNRMAYQELINIEKLKINLGDRIHWVNIGENSGDPDFGFVDNKLGYLLYQDTLDNKSVKKIIDNIYQAFENDPINFSKKLTQKNFVPTISYIQVYNYIEYYCNNKTIDEIKNFFIEKTKINSKDKDKFLDRILEPYKKIGIDGEDVVDIIKNKTTISLTDLIKKEAFHYLINNDDNNYIRLKCKKTIYKKEIRIEIIVKYVVHNMKYVNNENLSQYSNYNIDKYINKFNEAIKPFLVVFNPEIRELFNATKIIDLDRFAGIPDSKFKLIKGIPYKDGVQTTEEIMMNPIKEERDFWRKMKKSPNYFIDNIEFNTDKKYSIFNNNIIEDQKGIEWHNIIDNILPPLNIVEELGFTYINEYYELITPTHKIHYGYYKSFKIYKLGDTKYEIVKLKKRKNSISPQPNDIDRIQDTLLNYGYDIYLERIINLKKYLENKGKKPKNIHVAYQFFNKKIEKEYGNNSATFWNSIK